MKMALKITLCLFCLLIFSGIAKAEEYKVEPPKVEAACGYTEKLDSVLDKDTKSIFSGLDPTDPKMGEEGLSRIFAVMKEKFFSIFKKALASALKMLTLVILGAACTSALEEGTARDTVSFCSAIAVSAIAISDVNAFFTLGTDTLHRLSDFSKVLLPMMCTAAASAGAITSAAAKYAATALFMDVIMTIGTNIIMPLVSLYLGSVIASAALGKDTLERVSNFLKWGCTTALTLLMTGFTAYLGISGLVSTKADEFTVKLTKSAMSSMLPVVGGILSDAAETVVSGAGLIRNLIGVFGFLAVAALCITPFISLGTHYLVYKGTAAVSEAISDKRMGRLISGVGAAFGMVLALVGASGLMLFFSVISSMKAVGVA